MSVCLQRWDETAARSLCQLHGHERSADGGVLLKVGDEKESGSGRRAGGRERKRSSQVGQQSESLILALAG